MNNRLIIDFAKHCYAYPETSLIELSEIFRVMCREKGQQFNPDHLEMGFKMARLSLKSKKRRSRQ